MRAPKDKQEKLAKLVWKTLSNIYYKHFLIPLYAKQENKTKNKKTKQKNKTKQKTKQKNTEEVVTKNLRENNDLIC